MMSFASIDFVHVYIVLPSVQKKSLNGCKINLKHYISLNSRFFWGFFFGITRLFKIKVFSLKLKPEINQSICELIFSCFWFQHRIQPVKMSVFHQHAKNVSKYHRHDYRDLLRIFFKDPNVSDKEIDMFLERKTLKDILPEEDYSKRDYNYMNDEAMFTEDPLNCK